MLGPEHPSQRPVTSSNMAQSTSRGASHSATPSTSPKKHVPPPVTRNGSTGIWDSFFQYNIMYQGGKGKK